MNPTRYSPFLARIAPALLIASALLGVRVDAAQPAAPLPSVTVRLDDLNLNSTAGIARLYKRIHFAARNVCALPDGDISTEVHALELRCMAETEAQTIDRMHIQALAALRPVH